MSHYVPYDLDDGSTLLIEIPEDLSSVVKAAREHGTPPLLENKLRFGEALSAARKSAVELRKALAEARADEVEVEFGLKATGELGNFAIAKAGVEANYRVTMTWKKERSRPK